MVTDRQHPISALATALALVTALLLGAAAQGAEPTATAAEKDPLAVHLERGQAYLEQGEYAKAVLEFEQVLRFDNLPPDLRERAQIYSKAARDYQEGQRLTGFGYAETGGGFYRENTTRTTNAEGRDSARDWFWNARIGGGLGYIVSDNISIDGGLDYQYRYYDDTSRRDDSDLLWNAAVVQSLAAGWSLRPELLYIRDEGDAEFGDYSATEIWVNVRKSF